MLVNDPNLLASLKKIAFDISEIKSIAEMQSVQFSLMAATLKLSLPVKCDTLQWCDKENGIKEKCTFLITQTIQWRQVIVPVGLCVVSWVFLFKSALAQPRALTPFAEKKSIKLELLLPRQTLTLKNGGKNTRFHNRRVNIYLSQLWKYLHFYTWS